MAKEDKNIFRESTVVLACSGPSLNKVNPFSLGYPVVAISTAIRADAFKYRKPDAWLLTDMPVDRKLYQGKRGQFLHTKQSLQQWKDPEVLKVLPTSKRKNIQNKEPNQFKFYDYDSLKEKKKRKKNECEEVFNGNMPFVRGPSMSITFALQWCYYVGIRTVLFAGCDLVSSSIETKYAYDIEEEDRKKVCNPRQLNRIANTLIRWYPIAQRKGFKWYNWKSGIRLGCIIPSYQRRN